MDLSYCDAILLGAVFLILFIMVSNLTNKNRTPRNWPILGVMPAVIGNSGRFLDWLVLVMEKEGCTLEFKGSWLFPQEIIFTADPSTVQYTSSTKFSNFPRGPKSKELFDVFGESQFNSDSEEWLKHRRILQGAIFNHKQFKDVSTRAIFKKVQNGLFSVLDDAASGGSTVGHGDREALDLQEVFQRYTYDLTHFMTNGEDPKTLSVQWPDVPFVRSLNTAMEAVFLRHLLPERVWKLQRMIGIGRERVLKESKEFLDSFAAEILLMKRKDIGLQKHEQNNHDMLTAYLTDENESFTWDDEVLNGTTLSFFLAGKDTTSATLTWFFWLLAQNPPVMQKIKEELGKNIPMNKVNKPHLFSQEEVSKLNYLQASLLETLRLYPPVPCQTRSAVEPDVLPTGHKVIPGRTMIIIPLFVMGRMTSIWGKDCKEFKPERWITEKGEIKHEPSHKFFSFNSGPRMCLGKELALIEMKAASAAIIHNYDVEILNADAVRPVNSIILQIEGGLHARFTRRWI